MTKADVVRKFITENPKLKEKKGIARELHKMHPKLFKDLENARDAVRRVTGASGKKDRNITDPEMVKFFYSGFDKWAAENLNTELEPFDEPYVFPNFKRLNVIADLHSVYLDQHVMNKFLSATTDREALLLNGDLIDSQSLSRHLKGHNLIEYDRELEICYQILKGLKEEFTHVYFREGNHDFWLERYLLTNAREIFKLRGIGLKELLRLGELGVHHIHNLKYMTYGDLDIIHGHEFPGYGAKFPAVQLVSKWQNFKKKVDVKVMQAHAHTSDKAFSRKSVDGKFGQAWSMPAMCKKAASYAPFAGKENGWAELNLIDGVTEVKLVMA